MTRNLEYEIRLALATIMVALLVAYKDDQLMVTWLFPNIVIRITVLIVWFGVIIWLNWGKLITAKRSKDD